MGIKQAWHEKLADFTGFDYDEISPCFDKVYSKYLKHFRKQCKNKNEQKVSHRGNEKENKKKRARILSGSRIGDLGKQKGLSKNSSQPLLDKFATQKATYLAYLKNSKLKESSLMSNLNNYKSVSRINTSSNIINLNKKRVSLDVASKIASRSILSRAQTPQNMPLGQSRKFQNRKMTSESTQRGQSSQYRKFRGARIGSRKQSQPLKEHKFKHKKVTLSRNRSNSVNSKLSRNEKILNKISKKSSKGTKLERSDTLQTISHQILATRDQNVRVAPRPDSQVKRYQFSLTEEAESTYEKYSKRQKKAKGIESFRPVSKYEFNNKSRVTTRLI